MLVHVCWPYDVNIRQVVADRAIAEAWNVHVLEELLAPWSRLPYFAAGFSGGVALALNGLHSHPRGFGAGGLGADVLSAAFQCPAHWPGRLLLHYSQDDPVYSGANIEIAGGLERGGQADLMDGFQRLESARPHSLENYAARRGPLEHMIRQARALRPCGAAPAEA